MDNYEKETLRGVISVFGGFCLHFCIGTYYMWGTILQYIVSYYRLKDNPTLTIDQSVIVFQILVQLFTLFIPIGSILIRKFPYPIYYCSAYGILYALTVLISSYVKNFWIFIFTYGFVSGALHGTQYVLPMLCAQLYFPKRKAFISGCIMAGIGLGTLCFNLTFFSIVNPDNLSPRKLPGMTTGSKYFYGDGSSVAENVPRGLRILALCWLCIGVFAGNLIKFPRYFQNGRHNKYKQNAQVDELEYAEFHIDLDPYFVMKVLDVGFELDTFQNKRMTLVEQLNSGEKEDNDQICNKQGNIIKLQKANGNGITVGNSTQDSPIQPKKVKLNFLSNQLSIGNNNVSNTNNGNNGNGINNQEAITSDRNNFITNNNNNDDNNDNNQENGENYKENSFEIAEESPSNFLKYSKQAKHFKFQNQTPGDTDKQDSGSLFDNMEEVKKQHMSMNMDHFEATEMNQLLQQSVISEKKLARYRQSKLIKIENINKRNSLQIRFDIFCHNQRPVCKFKDGQLQILTNVEMYMKNQFDEIVLEGKNGQLVLQKYNMNYKLLNISVNIDQKIYSTRTYFKEHYRKLPHKMQLKFLTEEQIVEAQHIEELQEKQELDKKKQDEELYYKLNCPSVGHAVRCYNFKYFFFLQSIIIGVYLYVTQIYKNFGSEYISNDKLLTLIGSLSQVCNAFGRITINYMMERIGFKTTLILINICGILQLALISTSVKYTYWYMIWIFYIYYIQGGINGLIPGCSAILFGIKTGSQVLGFFMIGQALVNWIEYLLLVTIKAKIDYQGLFYLNLGVLVCTFIGILFFRPAIDWSKENHKWNENTEIRHQKQLNKEKKKANIYLREKVKNLEDQNYQMNFQLQELKAFIKYNILQQTSSNDYSSKLRKEILHLPKSDEQKIQFNMNL